MHAYLHAAFGLCLWDLLALLMLVALVILLVGHGIRQRQREQAFAREMQKIQKKAGPMAGPAAGYTPR